MIILFGTARSGSTWLAKVFDSHPDTLYLHEPDITDRGSDLIAYWFDRAPTAQDTTNARQYLARLLAARNLRTMGQVPSFRKSYRNYSAEVVRRAMIYGSKALERVGLSHFANRVQIPDLLATAARPPEIVIKTVSALGRAEVMLEACKGKVSPILLIRHPCAFVYSMLRGEEIGVMPPTSVTNAVAATRAAKRLGFDLNALKPTDRISHLAWSWLIANAEAYPAIVRNKGTVVRYEDLVLDPFAHTLALFQRLGLDWPDQAVSFLRDSRKGGNGYYSVYRDATQTTRWDGELSTKAIGQIEKIVVRDPIGSQFFDR